MHAGRRVFGLALAAAAMAIAAARAQDPQQPTFRAQTALVPIDVRVLDRGGQPITDLTPSDFTILENGVRQNIRHFALQLITRDAAAAADRLTRVTADSPLTTRNRRVFLIVLGGGRLQHPAMGVDATIRFIREQVFPQDQVAILGYNRATDFSTSPEPLLTVLERFKLRHERISTDIDECARNLACASQLRDGGFPPHIQTAIDEVFSASDGFRAVATGRATDAATLAKDTRRIGDDLQRAEVLEQRKLDRESLGLPSSPFEELELTLARAATGAASFDEYAMTSHRSRGDLGRLYTGIDYLRYVDGEKHLLYLTNNGMVLPRVESELSVAAAANDARVAISVIQTGGHALPALPSGGFGSLGAALATTHLQPGEPLSQRLTVSSMRMIAELTGGQASIYDFAAKGFDRVVSATSASYLLGYYPEQAALDGRYRRIEVRVNRRGAQVFFRHGYYARPSVAPIDRRRQMTYTRIASAINQISEIGDLPVTIRNADTRGANDSLEFAAEITVDPKRMTFALEEGRRRASLEFAIFCQDDEENPVGDLWQTMNLNLSEATFDRMMREGITNAVRIRVTRPVVGVKVAVYDYASDRVGTAVRRVR